MKPTHSALIAAAGLLAVAGVCAARKTLSPPPLTASARPRRDAPRMTSAGTLLPNGWVLHPAGRQIPTGDLPLAMTLSPDGRYVLVSTGGYAPCQVLAIDEDNEQVQTTQTLDQTWEGMAFGRSGDTLYVSGGGRGLIWRFHETARGGDLVREEPLPVDKIVARPAPYDHPPAVNGGTSWIAGLASAPSADTLFALDDPQNTLYALDPKTGKAKASAKTGDHPNAVAVSPDGSAVWTTNQGGGSVSAYGAAALNKIADVPVGAQPVALLFNKDGSRLFVANSGSNTVSVIDTATRAVTETIRTSLFPQAPTGSTPNAMALSPDGRRLFVTNADNNDVAVIDVTAPGQSRVLGFIPTAWYPTTVTVSADGNKLFVGCARGLGSRPSSPLRGGGTILDIYNVPGQSYGPRHDHRVTFDYVSSIIRGTVSVIDMPDDAQLARYTAQVIQGCPYRDSLLVRAAESPAHSAVPSIVGGKSPITHIVYIIKENRTYDQVFGDLPEGNGDPALTLFGANVTPNHHALAKQFTLMDNLYTNGDVSEDGHQWCNAAFCTDWTEKVFPGNYAGPSRGDAPGDDAVAASSGGYLWDNCAKHGLTYRDYGEFTDFHSNANSAPVATSASPALRGHISVAWELATRQDKGRDYKRVDAFISELHDAEKTGQWPNYMVMSLGEDHTVGTYPGRPTPWAAVGSNDLGIGKIVDAVSHSKFWPQTAVFIMEDDAQAGPDHVDSHRTVGLVVSPYVKRHAVDHTFYTTSSFVRTMELLLGLPPMTQYDAGATPLFSVFTDTPNLTPFRVLPPRVDLEAKNPRRGPGAVASARMDFSHYDLCDPMALNHVLWRAVKGPGVPYPKLAQADLPAERAPWRKSP